MKRQLKAFVLIEGMTALALFMIIVVAFHQSQILLLRQSREKIADMEVARKFYEEVQTVHLVQKQKNMIVRRKPRDFTVHIRQENGFYRGTLYDQDQKKIDIYRQ